MRYRGHGWERCGEMAAAMFALGLRAARACSGSACSRPHVVLPLEMALMLPAMIAVMALRFEEYAEPHGSAAATTEPAA